MADNKDNKQVTTNATGETVTTPSPAVAGDTTGVAKPQEGDTQARAKDTSSDQGGAPKAQQRQVPPTKAASNAGPVGGRYLVNGVYVNAKGEEID